MKTRLAALKNIIWALGIVVSLLAVFIGLLFSAFTRSSEEQFRGGLKIGTGTVSTQQNVEAATRPA